ncbi:hypothetical protein BH10PSE7_BH10PSE7_44670 [soil metagenome]
MNKQATQKASEFEIVYEGKEAVIRLSPKALKEFNKIRNWRNANQKQIHKRLQILFDRFCTGNALPIEDFRKEPGVKGTVWAFKAPQWRLYGGILTIGGIKTFVGVRVDPAKKQQKADQALLNKAADDLSELAEV